MKIWNENVQCGMKMCNENVQCAVCVSGRLRKCVVGNLVSQMKSQGFKNTLDFRHAPGKCGIHYKEGFVLEQFQLPQRATCQQRGNKCPFFGVVVIVCQNTPPFLINSYCLFCTGWCLPWWITAGSTIQPTPSSCSWSSPSSEASLQADTTRSRLSS